MTAPVSHIPLVVFAERGGGLRALVHRLLPLLLLLLLHTSAVEAELPTAFPPGKSPLGWRFGPSRPGVQNCTWGVFEQTLDHFAPGVTPGNGASFSQRYCIYDKFARRSPSDAPTPIFFYTGNESPVEEYVNNTGLMWELGLKMGAVLIFAEHRYEGESVPKLEGVPNCLAYCSSSQALADYAMLLQQLKIDLKLEDSPVIAFGGSYGGMLASWFRMKYPSTVVGAISASAPIWGFPLDSPDIDGASTVITRGVSKPGGATDQCRDNLLASWPLLTQAARTSEGRKAVSESLNLCSDLEDGEEWELLTYLHTPWFLLAEGNYPFPSTYITYAVGPGYYPLPPWPMRVACAGLDENLGIGFTGNVSNVTFSVEVPGGFRVDVDWNRLSSPTEGPPSDASLEVLTRLFSRVEKAVSVWYNVSGTLKCHDIKSGKTQFSRSSRMLSGHKSGQGIPGSGAGKSGDNVCTDASYKGSWGPLCCNEDINLVNTLSQGVGNDFFWPPSVETREEANLEALLGPRGKLGPGCKQFSPKGLFGVPDASDSWSQWMSAFYGDKTIVKRPGSNIVFSNGLLDPWSSAGVYATTPEPIPGSGATVQNLTSDGSSIALILDLGAHHLDLFFSTDEDPPCAAEAREIEERFIRKWIVEHQLMVDKVKS